MVMPYNWIMKHTSTIERRPCWFFMDLLDCDRTEW